MSHPAIAAGRTAVITGAAAGRGLAAARALAAQGMTIAMIELP
jgi:NAD(P)-dependent dehydrogenase (short-subunit alcohol dehydrogenase family)